jgi:signal transduction histidine kinase
MNLATIVQQARELDPQLADAAEEGQALVRELSQEIRTMSYLLHPPLLDESGLCEALRWYIKGLKDRSALNITLEIPDEFERVPREMELVIFRIVQEGLTNIHRHSGSKVATIRLARDSQSVSLELQDAGRGISREKLIEIQTQGTGVGIRGMRERVIQSGGKMKIHSDTSGTKISITLPFVKSDYSPLIEPIQMQSAG